MYSAAILGPFGGAAVFALVPSLKAAFDVGAAQALATLTAFMLPFALLQLVAGAIADAWSRRGALLGGLALYTAGSAVCTVAPEYVSFLLGRVAQGAGFAFVTPVLAALLGEITESGARGRAFGYFGSALMVGLALGPLVAGSLAVITWRATFGLLAVVGAMLLVLWWRFFADRPRAPHEGRSLLVSVARSLLAALRDPRVLALCALGFAAFFVIIGATSFLADWLSLPPRAYSEQRIGLVVSAWGFAGIVFSPLAGAWVDRIGARVTILGGVALTAFPLLLLRTAGTFSDFFLLVLLMGAAASHVWTPLLTLTVELQPKRRATVASLFNGLRFLGYAAAPVVLAPLYETRGVGAVYLVAAAVSVLSALLVPLLGARRHHREA